MPFRNKSVDRTQPEIVKALRDVGCSVEILSAVGKGVPDLLVGYRSVTLLMECKDGLARKQDRQLTDRQVKWHKEWKGSPVCVVESIDQALAALEQYR